MHFYQVGGAVRDMLLHKSCQDRDFVVTGGTEKEMLALGFKKVGKSFPVFLHPETGEEYALARREVKTGLGHCDFKFEFTPDITLEEDSLRRDFTCNALYRNPDTGEILDFHQGRDDIKKRVLRHISEHFAEDPLRVLRMCRFAAQLEFAVAPETMALCRRMVEEGALAHLSRQRIWQEREKALGCRGFYLFVRTARECGALSVLLPEIGELWNVPERRDYHPEGNSGEHTVLSLKAADTDDAMVNLAVLLHDVGKTATDPQKWPSHRGHDLLGAEIIGRIAARLQIPEAYTGFARFCALNHMVSHRPPADAARKLARIAVDLLRFHRPDYIERFIAVMSADVRGRDKPFSRAEQKNFAAIAAMLERFYQKASTLRFCEYPEFRQALEALKEHRITSVQLRKKEAEILLRQAEI